jgi:hypothetical protein
MLGHFYPLRKAARIGRARRLAVEFAAVALCGALLTQGAVAGGGGVNATPPQTPAPGTTPPPGTTTWGGLSWGIGISTDFDIGGARVANASIITSPGGSIVRVTDTSSKVGISFVLESHYFFPGTMYNPLDFKPPGQCGKDINCTEWAWGPFIAIEVGDGSTSTADAKGLITAFAMGMMVGMHHPKLDSSGAVTNNTSSWNFGIGFRVDPMAKVLGDGFAANVAPPAGETAIRYKNEPRAGVMLLSSFSF